MGVSGQATVRPIYLWERYTVTIGQEACWTPGPVWKGGENLASTGVRSPDRASLESRYTD